MRTLVVSTLVLAAALSACQKKKKPGKSGSEDATECMSGICYGPSDAIPAKQPVSNRPGGGSVPGTIIPTNPPAAKPTPVFKATEGTTIATISIRAGSGSVQNISRIDIRAELGDKAPSNCTQGTLIHSATTKLHAVSYTDSSWPEENKSYRACFYSGSKLAAEVVANAVKPRSFHTIFVSSEAYDGNLRQGAHDHPEAFSSAKKGADYRCQHLAQKAGFSGNWAAFITTDSSGEARASNHRVFGGIYNNKHERQRAVTSRSGLWSASPLASNFNADELGRPIEGSVWTGTSDSGSWQYSCGGFTSTNGNGTFGIADSVDGTWLASDSGSCAEARHLYCIDRVPDDIAVTTESTLSVTAGSEPATIDVDVTLPDADHIGDVRIYAYDGNQDAGRPLSCESPDFHEVLVRAYTSDPRDLYEAPTNDAFRFQHASDGYFSHRMCVWDLYGNLISEHKQPAILTSGKVAADYHYAFILGGLSGDLGGLDGADERCLDAAHAAGLTDHAPNWKALLSATGNAAKDRIHIEGKVYVVGGHQLYTANKDDLFSATGPRSGIKYTAQGSFMGSMDAWTGSTASGGISANHCRDWTSHSPDDRGGVGYADIHGTSNINAGQNRCYMTGGLICISQK